MNRDNPTELALMRRESGSVALGNGSGGIKTPGNRGKPQHF
jgi:hypothetical protein